MAQDFLEGLVVKKHPRGHDLHMGKIKGTNVDVGIISTGMGCPSVDIIMSELILLGGKWFVRIGTSGSMNKTLKVGGIVIGTGGVRDEGTSRHYAPMEYPSLASPILLNSLT